MNRRPHAILPSFLGPDLAQSFENLMSPMSSSLGSLRDSILAPRADVRECGDHYAICVDMPGVANEDIEVEVNDGVLTIQGSRRANASQEAAGVHRVERFMGTFQRRFALPDNVDFEAVSASSRDGVLEVRVPKLPERAPRKIKVETLAADQSRERPASARSEQHSIEQRDTATQQA